MSLHNHQLDFNEAQIRFNQSQVRGNKAQVAFNLVAIVSVVAQLVINQANGARISRLESEVAAVRSGSK